MHNFFIFFDGHVVRRILLESKNKTKQTSIFYHQIWCVFIFRSSVVERLLSLQCAMNTVLPLVAVVVATQLLPSFALNMLVYLSICVMNIFSSFIKTSTHLHSSSASESWPSVCLTECWCCSSLSLVSLPLWNFHFSYNSSVTLSSNSHLPFAPNGLVKVIKYYEDTHNANIQPKFYSNYVHGMSI